MTSSSNLSSLRPSGEAMDRRIARPKLPRRRLLIAAAAVVALAALAAAARWLVPASDALAVDAKTAEFASVRSAPFDDYLPVRAEVAPLQTVYVTVLTGGQVRHVLARDGQHVAAGEPLATLANPSLQLDVTSREAEITARLGDVAAQEGALQRARAEREQQIAEANYELLKTQRELSKRQTLQTAGLMAEAAVKPYADEAAYDRSRVAALQQELAQENAIAAAQRRQIQAMSARLSSNLALVHDSLGALTVRAPVAGRLTAFDLQPGQALTNGQGVGQVDSEDAYKLTAEVDEFYLGRVRVGQPATGDIDGKTVRLQVLRVLPQVTNGRFKAEFAFVGPSPANLRRGQGVEVRLTLGETRPALVLPNAGWLEGSGGNFAFVLRPGGRRADRRQITTGRRNPDQVEVTGGLRPGERVLVSSYAGLEAYKHLILR